MSRLLPPSFCFSFLLFLLSCQSSRPKDPPPLKDFVIRTHPTKSGMPSWYYQASERIVSTPKVGYDGTIYITSLDQSLTAVTPEGKKKWRFETDGLVVAAPETSADGSVIYFGSRDGSLYAVSTAGYKLWSYRTQGPIESPPAVDSEGYIYVASTDNYLYALKPGKELSESNRLRWPPVRAYARFVNAKPSFFEERGILYVADQNGQIYAVQMSNGKVAWTTQTLCDRVTSSTAADTDGAVYMACWDGRVFAIQPDSTTRWKQKWVFQTEVNEDTKKAKPILSSPRIGTDGTIYVGSDDGWFYAITSRDGKQLWRFQSGIYTKDKDGKLARQDHSEGYIQSTAETNLARAESERRIYFGSSNEYLSALNIKGELVWQLNLHGWVDHAAIFYSDPRKSRQVLYVAAGRYLYAVNP